MEREGMMEWEKEMGSQMGEEGHECHGMLVFLTNAEVAVVTRGQRQGGGRQSRDPASSPKGGCHKPTSLNHRCTRWGEGKEKRTGDWNWKLIASHDYVSELRFSTQVYLILVRCVLQNRGLEEQGNVVGEDRFLQKFKVHAPLTSSILSVWSVRSKSIIPAGSTSSS